jgi:hypothetical protein
MPLAWRRAIWIHENRSTGRTENRALGMNHVSQWRLKAAVDRCPAAIDKQDRSGDIAARRPAQSHHTKSSEKGAPDAAPHRQWKWHTLGRRQEAESARSPWRRPRLPNRGPMLRETPLRHPNRTARCLVRRIEPACDLSPILPANDARSGSPNRIQGGSSSSLS